ncbi:MAG: hypothetical protein IT422_16490 [Pirellulaceae bacterium]|nr:hypothetical protein [Pirellulaceae bacterium]
MCSILLEMAAAPGLPLAHPQAHQFEQRRFQHAVGYRSQVEQVPNCFPDR